MLTFQWNWKVMSVHLLTKQIILWKKNAREKKNNTTTAAIRWVHKIVWLLINWRQNSFTFPFCAIVESTYTLLQVFLFFHLHLHLSFPRGSMRNIDWYGFISRGELLLNWFIHVQIYIELQLKMIVQLRWAICLDLHTTKNRVLQNRQQIALKLFVCALLHSYRIHNFVIKQQLW